MGCGAADRVGGGGASGIFGEFVRSERGFVPAAGGWFSSGNWGVDGGNRGDRGAVGGWAYYQAISHVCSPIYLCRLGLRRGDRADSTAFAAAGAGSAGWRRAARFSCQLEERAGPRLRWFPEAGTLSL